MYLLPDRTKGGKRKSKTKKNTLNPVFDEILTVAALVYLFFQVTTVCFSKRLFWCSSKLSELLSVKSKVQAKPNRAMLFPARLRRSLNLFSVFRDVGCFSLESGLAGRKARNWNFEFQFKWKGPRRTHTFISATTLRIPALWPTGVGELSGSDP